MSKIGTVLRFTGSLVGRLLLAEFLSTGVGLGVLAMMIFVGTPLPIALPVAGIAKTAQFLKVMFDE